MIKNYFKIAFRNLKRNRSYAFINTSGLAVGIGACLLLFLIIQLETGFDSFHSNKKNIYRIVSEFKNPEGINYSSGVPFPTANALRNDFPQLKTVAAIYGTRDEQITVPAKDNELSKNFKEVTGVFFSEPQFFDLFNFKLLAGSIKTALSDPNTVLLSKESAEKYFGNWTSAIGKSITLNNKYPLKVTGILDDIPANTDFPLKVVISYSTLKSTNMSSQLTDWISVSGGANCYVLFPNNYSAEQFKSSLNGFVKKYKPAEYVKDGLSIQPLGEIHYDSRFGNFTNKTFSKDLINVLSLIGVFLLIIACVNFINLATAQAINRSKEVGIRKVMGSSRNQLMLQFMGETGLITFFSILVAVLISATSLPLLNNLLEIKLSLSIFKTPQLIIFLIAAFVFVTLLSGLYPALILSGYNPINALKSKIAGKTSKGITLRRGLVVLQFVIAQVLIIGTLVVVSQMNYFRSADLGFNKEAIINVPLPGDSLNALKLDVLKDKLVQQPGIKNVSFSFASPADNGGWYSDFKYNNAVKSSEFSASFKWADTAYFKTYNLQLKTGRMYLPGDTVKEFVVNETFVKKLGVHDPQEVIGKKLNFWGGRMVAPIVGVVKDFHSESLRDPIVPVVMSTWKRTYQVAGLKIQPDKARQILTSVEKLWNNIYPEYIFEYQFLDEKIADFYKQEAQLSRLYKIFAAIAIFISCLGLYGLISFMAVQRTKEVGIRKVLGASARNIVYLLSKEFTILIIIAFAIAAPVAYYFMHQWLQKYTFRIHLGAGIFLLTILISIIIAWITVSYRAIKASLANPVKSLRTE
ncbi:MAG: ABC transporter permease [Chitinophagaceae bacterium]